MGTMNWRLCPQDHYAFSFLTCCSSRSATSATPRRKKNDSGNRRQGGGGWGTPLKKRSATRIKDRSQKAKDQRSIPILPRVLSPRLNPLSPADTESTRSEERRVGKE